MSLRYSKAQEFYNKPENYITHRHRIMLRAKIIRELLWPLEHMEILDIGCGDGSLSLQFLSPTNRISLVDLSSNMLALAHQQTPNDLLHRVEYHLSSFENYKPSSQFNVVLCIGVLAHVENVEETINKIYRLLKPGGVSIIQFTDQSKLITKVNQWFLESFNKTFSSLGYYKLNQISYDYIKQICTIHNLRISDEKRYSLLLPGFGHLPKIILYYYQLITLKNHLLSKYGTEVILKIEKQSQEIE